MLTHSLLKQLITAAGLTIVVVYTPAILADNLSPASSHNEKKPVNAEIIAHGEKAHKNHCYKCHTDQVYTRKNHFVKSIDALSKQVERCKNNNNIPWFDEDAEAVVQFLNQKYYKF